MVTTTEYTQLSSRVYAASDDNRTFVPTGWAETWYPDNGVGFSAGVYRKGSDIVISYTGTNDATDWWTNIGSFLGFTTPQIFSAMRLYLDVKTANPGANITFTGHSLGGGLSSLMSVFFNRPATVFAEAPFLLTAINPVNLSALQASLLLSGYTDLDFALYNASFGTLYPFRAGNVTNHYLDGEAVSNYLTTINQIGSGQIFSLGQSTSDPVDRHSMLLHEAAIYSPKFLLAAQKLKNLVTLLLDKNLYAADRLDPIKTDLLSMLLRHQFGDGASIAADKMLDGFSRDALKLAGGGLIKDAPGLEDALIKAQLQGYSRLENDRFTRDLFTSVPGGFYLDTNRIATDASSVISYSSIAQALLAYHDSTIPMAARLSAADRWYFQSGLTPLIAKAEDGHHNLIAGWQTGDKLTGASGDDLLLGAAGNDLIEGGNGNDWDQRIIQTHVAFQLAA